VPDTGRLIGNYRLGELIGEGGMGEVYLAEREKEFRKRVAIKLIRPGMANLEIVRRFVIERQTLAVLNHPQIVHLIDGGTTGDGLPYLVVDYVDGIPIDLYCDRHKLSVTARLELFLQVCNAVHHAHQNLIVHCDLKPGNILVTPEGVPMLLDFGIAKLLDPVSMGISTNIAKTRQRAFTPSYASPEQLLGQPVTTSTDIYALGVILYEMLTGHSPYPVTANDAPAAWMKSVCEGDAEAPSTVIRRVSDAGETRLTPESVSESREGDPQKLERRLRGDLDAILLRALRKEPQYRYASVDQFADDIRRHLDGRPVLARKNTTGYVTRKFLHRHKIAMAATAVVLIALIAGLASTLWEARVAARRFEDVRRLAHTFLFDVHDSIQNLPGSTPARSLIARTGTDYLDRLSRDARGDASLQLELADGYLKIGDVLGNPYNANLGDTSKALDNYRKAAALAESAVSAHPKDIPGRQILARVHLDLASVLPFDGKAPEALDHIKKAEQLYREVWAARPNNAEARLDLSRAYDAEGDIQGGARAVNLGHFKEAAGAYQQSVDMVPNLPASDPFSSRASRARAVELMKLGDMSDRTGHLDDALAKYQVALQTAEQLSRADPNDTRVLDMLAVDLNKIASIHTSLRNNQAAMETYQRAIETDEQILKADPNNGKARGGIIAAAKNLGDLFYYNLSQMPPALENYRRAAALLEAQAQSDPSNVVPRQHLAEVLLCVASTLIEMHQPAEARKNAQRGLAVAKELADRPGATQEQVYNYAYLGITVDPADLRNPQMVFPYARKAVEMSSESDPFALHVLAQTYAARADYTRAVQTEEKALALFPPVAPGKPVPNAQATVQHFLEECRQELKKRGGA
jgi:serine/threonine protein kinase